MMKNILTLCAALLLSLSSSAREQQDIVTLKGAEAAKVFSYANELWVSDPNAVPTFIAFREDAQIDELNFLPIVKKCFALPAGYGATLVHAEKDQIGWEHNRYQLTYNGIPVNEGNFILHMINGRVVKFNGFIPKTITASTSSALTESQALSHALAAVHAETYRWQEANSADFFPKGELCIAQAYSEIGTSAISHLAWKFDVFATAPLSRDYIYVDAQTGAILRKDNRIETANTASTAVTAYRGSRAIVADSYNGSYRLRETTRGLGVSTYNMRKGTSYTAAVDFTNATTTWNNVNTNKDQYAGDAHWGAEMTDDFYLNTFGRSGINGSGFALKLYVHYDVNYLNAFWDGTEMNFGDGSTGYTPLTSLDITGHEISHGLTQYTANLNYQSQSGAMNEAFSDIMGTAVEWYADSTRANWTIGEDIGATFRSMANPKLYQQPNTYLGQYWYTGTQDNGGVHTNSGVENRWYYLLSMGGTGTNDNNAAYNVTGIGRAKATAIAFRMQTVYLIATSQYTDARFYAIQAATDLYGACSQEVISTANAWYAVGVGTAYSASVASQFTYSNTVGCSAPLTVNFTNQSSNTSIYTWYFGDGTTSTLANPTHIYATAGVYTVKLVSSGGCGRDSVTKTNLVNISSSNPCVVVLPSTGTAPVQTSCTGTIYDDGGAHAPYSNSVNSTVTIAPTGAATVRLTFTAFRTEANYDYVYVYDGSSVAGTLLGTYTGTTIPASISSTLPSITVKFVSDGGVIDTGFAINWVCTSATVAPTANYISDVNSTCTGKVQFTDQSAGGPTSWLWAFGDGTTSTLRNPLKTYYANGTYTVSLTSTNAFGTNTKTVVNKITVSKPAAPTVVNGSRCGTGSVVLSSPSTNTINWYDSAAGSVPVSSANPFNTPSITGNKNYYAEEVVQQTIYHVGPVDSTIGAGSYFNGNNTRALRFKVAKPSRLVSVFVYALTTGYRTIQYRDTNGVVIASRSVYIQAGRGRVNLNIDLVPSTTTIYELGVADSMNLFRNIAGGVYPYTDAQGMVSIIGNNISNPTAPGYYYYFYDWEVQAPDCISLRATATASVTSGITDTKSITPAPCYGQSSGAASVNVTSGSAPVTYHWSNGPTISSISNVAAATYTVTISDNSGCSKIDTLVVTQPTAALTATITPTNIACFGSSTGSIALTASGGTAAYSYNWGGGITTAGRTGLGAGTYTVTITDAYNCVTTSSTTITQPSAALTAVATPTSVACYGASTGSIALTASGGTTSYSYNWGGSITTPARTGLAAGTYTVTVTDARNCITTTSTTITQPAAALTATATPTTVACFGGSTGSIALTATGGTANYSYNWGGGITTAGRTGLAAGTYTVTITDAHSCTATSSTTITQPAAALTVVVTPASVACYGGSTGSIALTASGGTTSYSYNWGGGITTPGRTGLAAGTYTVTITDGRSCVTTAAATIAQPASAFSVSFTPISVACFGASTGAISVNPSGGTSTYTYNWGGGITTQNRIGLSAGTYSVTATDAHSCITSASVTVSQPAAALTASATPTAVLCFGGSTGAIALSASGGTAGYTYNWGSGITTPGRTGLGAGTYTVTITDAHSCTTTKSTTISQPATISIQGSSVQASCGQSNGSATATASGGTGTLSYAWTGGQTTPTATSLSSGNYIVTVTDINHCTATQGITVTSPAAFTLSNAITPATCHGTSTGTATITPSSTLSTYTYTWTGGLTGAIQSTLTAGTYLVTVSDAGGCSRVDTVEISQPAAITDILTGTSPACHGSATGAISLQAQGGTGVLGYQWTPALTTLTGLSAGTYTLTITDGSHCTATDAITLTEPSSVTATAQVTNILCFGASTGSATLTAAGGTAPYSYHWTGGSTASALSGVAAGTYVVAILDSNNCAKADTLHITQPASAIQASATSTIAHNGGSDGTATVTASGGTGTLSYSWNTTPAQSGATTSNLPSGTYTVTITDANGCNTTAQAIVDVNTGITTLVDVIQVGIFPNPATTTFTISVDMPQTSDINVEIRDLLGRIISSTLYPAEKQLRTSIDASSWAAAVYALRIQVGDHTITKKITIQH